MLTAAPILTVVQRRLPLELRGCPPAGDRREYKSHEALRAAPAWRDASADNQLRSSCPRNVNPCCSKNVLAFAPLRNSSNFAAALLLLAAVSANGYRMAG